MWKPIRTHHCKVCQTCTLRMDHHCPWTVSCIGANSHKAFYLTAIYWAVNLFLSTITKNNLKLGGLQYLYRSYYFYYYYEPWNTFSYFFYAYWIYTTFIVFFITCMLLSLVYYHSLMAMSNATSIEDRKGTKLCFGIFDTLLMAKDRSFNVIFMIFNFYKKVKLVEFL